MNEQKNCERPGTKSLPLRGRWHGEAVTEGVLWRPAEPLGQTLRTELAALYDDLSAELERGLQEELARSIS